jgi:cutinase
VLKDLILRLAGRAGVGLAAVSAAAVLLVNPIAALPLASADDCQDAEVVFARGTNEPPGLGRVGDAFVDSLRQQAAGLNIGTYGVNYAASKLQLHGGDGANDVISHVKKTISACPNTKIVLGGYSQGASVMDIVAGVPIGGISWGSSLPPEYVSNIAAVVTFGDVADRAGGSLPTMSTMLGSKAIDFCNPVDPICHAGAGNEWSGHTEGYVPVYTTQGAAFAAPKLMTLGVPHMPGQLPVPQVPGAVPQVPGSVPQVPGAPATAVPAPVAQVPGTPATAVPAPVAQVH